MATSSVFISYRRRDKAFVLQLDAALRQAERSVWIDWEDIPPGVLDFQESIKEGIEGSEAFILVLTPEYLESDYCLMELDYAYRNSKRLVPVVLQQINPTHVPESISHINWVYFNGEDDFQSAFKKVLVALDTDYSHVKTHTDILVRARQWEDRGHDTSLLLRGNELQFAQTWLQNAYQKKINPSPSDLHTNYIESSQMASKRRRRIYRAITAVVTIIITLGLVAMIAGVVAFDQRNKAIDAEEEAVRNFNAAQKNEQEATRLRLQEEQQRQRAERERTLAEGLALAGNSLVVLGDDDTDLAIALALAAENATESLEAAPLEIERSLATAAYQPGTRHRFEGHNGWVRAVAAVPNTNWIISASHDGGLNIWDLETGDMVRRLRGHNKPVTTLAVSPDGRYVLSGSEDNQVILWDVQTGQILHRMSGHTAKIRSVTFTPDGSLAFSGGEDGILRWWDVATGTLAGTFDPEGNTWIMDIVYSWDNSVWLAYNNSQFEQIDFATLTTLNRYQNPEDGPVYSIAVDGTQAVTVGGDDLFVWDLVSGLLEKRLSGHTDVVLSADISSNGAFVLSGSSDQSLRIWDIETGEELERLAGHDDLIWSAAFLTPGDPIQNPRFAISGSEDFTVRLWDLFDGSELIESNFDPALTYETTPISHLALSADGTQMLLANTAGVVRLADANTGQTMLTISGDPRGINAMAFAGDYILTGGHGLQVWNRQTGALWQTFTHPTYSTVLSVAYLPQQNVAIAGYEKGALIKWDLATGAMLQVLSGGNNQHTNDVLAVAVSPDGQWIASADEASPRALIIIWDVGSGQPVFQLREHNDRIRALAFDPSSTLLLSGAEDNVIIEWNVFTGTNQGQFEGHTGRILSLAFSPTGERVISGSSDQTVRVWDAFTNVELRRFEQNTDDVTGVGFLTDTLGISASLDGTYSIWRVDRLDELVDWANNNRFVRRLTINECEVYRTDSFCEGDEEN